MPAAKLKSVAAIALGSSLLPNFSAADEVSDLQAQLQALQAKLDRLERQQLKQQRFDDLEFKV